jgi:hypothetical protein
MKKIIETVKQKWAEYLLEIFVIVIGIMAAFFLNNWNEIRVSKKIEKEVLGKLFQDIESDKMELEKTDSLYQLDIQKLTNDRNLIWNNSHTKEEALLLNGYEGFVNRDVNPRRTTYDEMINSGKLYYLSNQGLVNEIIEYYELIENHIYQERQDRIEFRALFYSSEALNDYWLAYHDSENEELAYKFFNDPNTRAYKNLKVTSSWSVNIVNRKSLSVSKILLKNKELLATINKEITY